MAVTGAFYFLRTKCRRQAKGSESREAIKPKTRKRSQPEINARSPSRARYGKSDKENLLFSDANRQSGNISSTTPALSSTNPPSAIALSSTNPSFLGKEVKSSAINSEIGNLSPVKIVENSHLSNQTSPSSSRSDLAASKDNHNSGSKSLSLMNPTAAAVPTSQGSAKSTKRALANSTSSRVANSSSRHASKSTQLEPATQPPPKAPSFWKRMSQPRSSTVKKPLGENAKTIPRCSSDSELHITNAPLATSQSEPGSALVPQIALDAPQAEEPQLRGANIGGLAGIGVRDRNSIASFALSSSNEVPTHKPNARSLSNYSPATSSPLSSQADCEEEILPAAGRSSTRPQSQNSRLSYQSTATRPPRPRAGGNRSRLSYQQNRLSFIPDGSVTGSEDLMKMLRGPSAYPDESVCCFFNNYITLCTCTDAHTLLILGLDLGL